MTSSRLLSSERPPPKPLLGRGASTAEIGGGVGAATAGTTVAGTGTTAGPVTLEIVSNACVARLLPADSNACVARLAAEIDDGCAPTWAGPAPVTTNGTGECARAGRVGGDTVGVPPTTRLRCTTTPSVEEVVDIAGEP